MTNENKLVEQARQLMQQTASGSLSTQSHKHPGYPFTSVAPFAVGQSGQPFFLLSGLATHTRNLQRDSKSSLLVMADADGDLAAGRLTLIGDARPLVNEKADEKADEKIESARSAYLQKHPEAQQWMSFGDFNFYEMTIVEAYFVAGFGSMGWIRADEFLL